MSFDEIKFKDLVVNLNSKRVPLSSKQRDIMTNKKYPYYGAQGIIDHVDDYIFDGEYLLIAEDGENLRSRNKNISQIATGKFWVNNHAHILKESQRSNLYFLKEIINRLDISGYLTGSAQPKLNKQNLNEIVLSLPSKTIQDKIGNFIKDMDQRQDLNNKVINKLELFTRLLFKKWFIDFDFPNEFGMPYKSNGGKLVESELGMIPDKWKVEPFKKMYTNFDRMRIPISKRDRELKEKIYPYYGAASLMDYVDDYIFEGTYLLLGEDGTVSTSEGTPVMQYIWGKFWVNNHAHVLQGQGPFSTEYIYLLLQQTNIESIITGAVQKKISQSNLNSLKMIYPEEEVLKKFSEVIQPFFSTIKIRNEENLALTKLREELLPKLLSGEINLPVMVDAF